MGWEYPPGSIIGKIFLVPVEEHLFFILQPIFRSPLRSIVSHPRLLPFDWKSLPSTITVSTSQDFGIGRKEHDGLVRAERSRTIQTLRRRPLAACFWGLVCLLGGMLINEAHGLVQGMVPGLHLGNKAFYLGWILVWISPVIGWLSWLGGSMGKDGWAAWASGSAWLFMVDT